MTTEQIVKNGNERWCFYPLKSRRSMTTGWSTSWSWSHWFLSAQVAEVDADDTDAESHGRADQFLFAQGAKVDADTGPAVFDATGTNTFLSAQVAEVDADRRTRIEQQPIQFRFLSAQVAEVDADPVESTRPVVTSFYPLKSRRSMPTCGLGTDSSDPSFYPLKSRRSMPTPSRHPRCDRHRHHVSIRSSRGGRCRPPKRACWPPTRRTGFYPLKSRRSMPTYQALAQLFNSTLMFLSAQVAEVDADRIWPRLPWTPPCFYPLKSRRSMPTYQALAQLFNSTLMFLSAQVAEVDADGRRVHVFGVGEVSIRSSRGGRCRRASCTRVRRGRSFYPLKSRRSMPT